MQPSRILLDPTDERRPATRPRQARLCELTGHTLGLLDISKARGDVFLDRLEQRLTHQGATVVRFRKPAFSRPAPLALCQEMSQRCDAVVEALAD